MKKDKINRRSFVTRFSLLGAVAGLVPQYAFSANERKSEEAAGIMKCKPYLQAVKKDAIRIRWITSEKCLSWVEYGENVQALDKKAYCSIDGLIQANNTIHDIPLKNLHPGRMYFYKVFSKKIEGFEPYKITYGAIAESETYTFTTLNPGAENTTFVVYNDVHDRPETFAQLFKFLTPGKRDFILLNGDIFSSLKTGEDQVIKNMLEPISELFSTDVPFVFSRGNHEDRGQYARQFPDYVSGGEQKFYFSFQSGPIYAVVLDSGEGTTDDNPLYGGILDFDAYRLEQKTWLEKEVQKPDFKKATYRVIINHIPPFYTASADNHPSKFCREHWGPILNKAKIDLMLAGHTHIHGIHPAVLQKHNFPIVIGGGPRNGERTIIQVNANKQALEVKMFSDTGKTIGELKIKNPKGK
ncbi:MAG: FN3 domain-containing metallophosphoesterase family protein [Pedobacter sp.]